MPNAGSSHHACPHRHWAMPPRSKICRRRIGAGPIKVEELVNWVDARRMHRAQCAQRQTDEEHHRPTASTYTACGGSKKACTFERGKGAGRRRVPCHGCKQKHHRRPITRSQGQRGGAAARTTWSQARYHDVVSRSCLPGSHAARPLGGIGRADFWLPWRVAPSSRRRWCAQAVRGMERA